ncbi:MAG: arylesterase [Nitrospira sp.]|nr:MAG: arylesterase [Nitrospira sp.]
MTMRRSWILTKLFCCLFLILLCWYDRSATTASQLPSSNPPREAVGPKPVSVERPSIVAFGDSLTAGLGVQPDQSYPARLQRTLDAAGYVYRVVNAGVSGETTAGGARRVSWVLKSNPAIVILELGGNDGLRGLSLQETKANLERIIQQLQQASVTVVLAGMKLPPNYGKDYTDGFESLYQALAKQYRLTLIPFFLDGVAGSSSLNQADGIHPTGEGYRIIVEKILPTLEPLLDRKR